MKYTKQEQLNEILIRGEKMRQRKDKNMFRVLYATAALLFISLVGIIGILGGGIVLESGTAYGSFLLSAEIGGYVLVAVLAFVTGIITAIVITRRIKNEKNEDL